MLEGSIILDSAACKNSLLEKLELEHLVKNLEFKCTNTFSCVLWKELDAARSALKQILTRKTETSLLFAWQRLYKYGKKPGQLLVLPAGMKQA